MSEKDLKGGLAMFCEIIVQPDTRWPIGPKGPVLEGRINGYRIFGWFTEEEFTRWLTHREGTVTKHEGDIREVIALVTKKEYKESRRGVGKDWY